MDYYTASRHASRPCFFDRSHEIVPTPVDFDYNEESNPDGVYCQCVIESKTEFQAGIKFVKLNFPSDALSDLMDMVIARCGDFKGEIPQELAKLIDKLNVFLPPELQKDEGTDYEIE